MNQITTNKGLTVASDPQKKIAYLKNQLRYVNRKLTRAKVCLSSAKARISALESKVKSTELHYKDTAGLSKKQKIVVDTMLKKCNIKNPNGMRYSNEFILESLLLKIKSPKGYRHCLQHELLPLPSEKHLRKLCKGFKCPYGVNPHAIDAIAQCYKDEDENNKYGVLIFDEVKLREEIQFNNATLKVDGFVDFGDQTIRNINWQTTLWCSCLFPSCKAGCNPSRFMPVGMLHLGIFLQKYSSK